MWREVSHERTAFERVRIASELYNKPDVKNNQAEKLTLGIEAPPV